MASRVVVICSLALGLAWAGEGQTPDDRGKDPVFVRWMQPDNPVDQTILQYWERAKIDDLSAEELVDLGTMLFHRGYPADAIKIYQRALEADSDLYEAWFRIGFVNHREGEEEAARHAYKKCLKRRPGHGWCNFYLGLLEEQTGHPSKALEHYRRAFTHAPELANPGYNPEVLSSDLSLGAALIRNEQERFTAVSPMSYLRPGRVKRVRAQFASTPTPDSDAHDSLPEDAGAAAAATDASGERGSADAPQPIEHQRPEVQRTPPSDTPFGLPVPQQQPTPAVPTPTPQP